MKMCKKCGTMVDAETKFCTKCGEAVDNTASAGGSKSVAAFVQPILYKALLKKGIKIKTAGVRLFQCACGFN